MTVKVIGYDVSGATGGTSANFIYYCKFLADYSCDVTSIRLYMEGPSAVKVALLTDNAGSPGTVINQVGTTVVVAGSNDIAITASPIVSYNYYWLAVVSNSANTCRYETTGGVTKYSSTANFGTFTFTDNPTGLLRTYKLSESGWGDTATTVLPPCMTATALMPTPTIAVAASIIAVVMTATGQAYAPDVTTTNVITINVPVMTATAQMNVPVITAVAAIPAHYSFNARYSSTKRPINRMYVVGVDSSGNLVYGQSPSDTSAINGELLDYYADSMITTHANADTVAANILAKDRLNIDRGGILTLPNCGIEHYDPVAITDSVANQTIAQYRVAGWTTTYDTKIVSGQRVPSVYEQSVNLTSI